MYREQIVKFNKPSLIQTHISTCTKLWYDLFCVMKVKHRHFKNVMSTKLFKIKRDSCAKQKVE